MKSARCCCRRRWSWDRAPARFVVLSLVVGGMMASRSVAEPAPAEPAPRRARFVIGALGDSMSTGFNSFLPLNNKRHSWSTGDSWIRLVNSHYYRLKDALRGVQVVAYNYAVAGSRSRDLPRKAAELAALQPDYVTITMGANDACHEAPQTLANPERFTSAYRTALATLVAARPDVRIVIVPVVDLRQVYEFVNVEHSCHPLIDLRRLFCGPLMSPWATADERRLVLEAREVVNGEIARLAGEFPANVRVAWSAAEDGAMKVGDVSDIDCFHPSVAGQNLLAEKTWGDGWYSDLTK